MTLTTLKLQQRIARRYQTRTVRLRLDDLELPFTRIAEPDRVLDEIVALEERRRSTPADQHEPPRVPYWAELWESALGLAQAIGRVNIAGKSVLDLGCGMGLAGAAAAAMGARVLMADIESSALLLARLNTLPWHERVRIRRVNWQLDRLGEQFDFILGADILYESVQWPYLNDFWQTHLTPIGTILLGEPGRQTGDLFPAWAQQRGWAIEQSTEQIEHDNKTIRIFRARRIKSI